MIMTCVDRTLAIPDRKCLRGRLQSTGDRALAASSKRGTRPATPFTHAGRMRTCDALRTHAHVTASPNEETSAHGKRKQSSGSGPGATKARARARLRARARAEKGNPLPEDRSVAGTAQRHVNSKRQGRQDGEWVKAPDSTLRMRTRMQTRQRSELRER